MPAWSHQAPRWAHVACALGLFVYQTLDAIDGKQARRTNTANALGELFDHGCDAISTIFVVVSTVLSLRLDIDGSTVGVCMLFMVCFFVAHWQHFVTGKLVFGRCVRMLAFVWRLRRLIRADPRAHPAARDRIDVTEGQMAVIALQLLSAWKGTDVWLIEVPYVGHRLGVVLMFAGILFMIGAIVNQLQIILFEHPTATVAGTSVVSPAIPLAILFGGAHYMFAHGTWARAHISAFSMLYGFAFTKITMQLVVAAMTRTPFPLMDPVLLCPALPALNLYFGRFIDEAAIGWLCFVGAAAHMLLYFVRIVHDITAHLGIKCFSIPSSAPQ